MIQLLCTGQQQLWRGEKNIKIKNSRPLFVIIFKPKMLVSRPEILLHLFYVWVLGGVSPNDLGRKKFVVVYIISWACKQQSRYNNVGEGSKMVIQTQICDDHTIPGLRCIFPQTIIDAEKGSSHVFSEVFPSIVKNEYVIVVALWWIQYGS